MIAPWVLYCLFTSSLLSLAALIAERAAGRAGHPVRALWAFALVGSLLLPAVGYLFPRLFTGSGLTLSTSLSLPDVISGSLPGPLEAGSASGGAPGWWGTLNATLLLVWIASMIGFWGFLARSWWRLRRRRKTWLPGKLLGIRCLLSSATGPAVTGFLRGSIVLPRWVGELDVESIRLIFLHEQEHRRTGDHRLFAAGLLGLGLMPWNPLLWWQLVRLRLAIECDCDRRVLRRGVSPRRYGEVLLEVGARLTPTPLAAAAFAEPGFFLERRVRRMAGTTGGNGWAGAMLSGGIALALLALSCETPTPSQPAGESGREAAVQPHTTQLGAGGAATGGEVGGRSADRPEFRPFDTPPRLENPTTIRRLLSALYPPALRTAGIGGRVELWLHVSRDGTVVRNLLKTSSGRPELDEAALALASRMSFVPARNQGRLTDVWVSQWITFEPAAAAAPPSRPADSGAERAPLKLGAMLKRVQLRGDTVELDGPQASAKGTLSGVGAPAPLILVDDAMTAQADLARIDGLDIDHIEILKGDLAVGRYGEAARGGVIRITTKK